MFEEEKRMYHYREDIKRASKEMLWVYVVIIFEEFLTDILSALFRKRHDVFRFFSNKQISYQQVLEHTKIYELTMKMSEETAKVITESGIDYLNDFLKDKLQLNLEERNDWCKFKEFFYRRNIVVHNYGVPDLPYIKKTNFKSEKDYWLEISDAYIKDAFNIFENYVNEIVNFFLQKYPDRPIRIWFASYVILFHLQTTVSYPWDSQHSLFIIESKSCCKDLSLR